MFYPFLKDHRHTTPPTDFHLPRPQLAIVEKFECNQFFIFDFFKGNIKKVRVANLIIILISSGVVMLFVPCGKER